MRKAYPSDITREQFEIIRKDLEGARKATHPRKYDLYDIFCAVLYLLKEGCTWRAIPHDYPNWRLYAITTIYGQNQITMESVCLIEFCVIWWKWNGKIMIARKKPQ